MNRTSAFLGAAAVLLLLAVVVGLPRLSPAPTVSPPAPTPVVNAPPAPPPVVPAPVANPGSLSLTGRLSHPYLVPGTSDVFATLEVSAVDVPGAKRAPVNLAVVIDRSGSMSGAKIENARRAAQRLVDLLGDEDRISVVHFGTDVSALGGVFATEENKLKLRRYIANIGDEGGTNIGDGLAVGLKHLERAKSDFRVNRLLLLSDGQPTVGITSTQGLTNVVRRIRDAGVSVTSLGLGSDFNEDLMQRLADVGGGSYGFISNASATAAIFQRDLEQAGTMVARTASLTFTLPDGVRFVEVYGRPVSQLGNTVTITLPDFSARQVEKLVVHLTASPSVRNGTVDIAGFQLAYTDLLTEKPADARLSLAAMVTEDSTLALGKRDKAAVVVATRARAAVNYQKAAEALDRGDFGGAKRFVKDNDAIFFEADAVAGEGSMADERATNSTIYGLSNNAPSAAPEQRREAVKQMKTESLRSSGRGASIY
ncbi:MAG: VWA domain-containing protein [Archangium sp.]|nr:VWA domain-containing protein [Archangium sp.]